MFSVGLQTETCKETKQTLHSTPIDECESLNIECTRDGRLMAKILSQNVNKKMVNFLIDSGACFNALSLDIAKELGLDFMNHNDKVTLSSFDGSLSNTEGSMFLKLHIGNFVYPIKFYILEKLSW